RGSGKATALTAGAMCPPQKPRPANHKPMKIAPPAQPFRTFYAQAREALTPTLKSPDELFRLEIYHLPCRHSKGASGCLLGCRDTSVPASGRRKTPRRLAAVAFRSQI